MAEMSAVRRWSLLVLVSSGLLLVTLDNSILYTALPELTSALGASALEKLWIINAYPLVMAGLLLGAGTLGDRVGHRRMFVVGLVVFGLASVLAAFSPMPGVLIAARALLAVGAAAIMPATLALLRTTFTDAREFGFAVSVWGSISVVGSAVGPLVSGALLERFWWGSVFLVNVPVVLLALATTPLLVPKSVVDRGHRWDGLSSALALVGLSGVVYAVKELAQPSPSVALVALPAALGLATLAVFVVRQRRLTHPLLDFTIFTSRPVLGGLVGVIASMLVIAGLQLVVSQRLQLVLEYSPLGAGVVVMLIVIGALPTSLLAGAWVTRVGLQTTIGGGLVVATVGVAVTLAAYWLPAAALFVGLVLTGIGLGAVMGTASFGIVGFAPKDRAGMASSVEEVGYELGSLSAVTAFGALLAATYAAAIEVPAGAPSAVAESIDAAREVGGAEVLTAAAAAFDAGYLATLAVLTVVCAAAAAFSLVWLRGFRGKMDTDGWE